MVRPIPCASPESTRCPHPRRGTRGGLGRYQACQGGPRYGGQSRQFHSFRQTRPSRRRCRSDGLLPAVPWIAHRGGGCLAPRILWRVSPGRPPRFPGGGIRRHVDRDQVPILIHDETLERTTDGRGGWPSGIGMNWPDLDAGRWLHRSWSGARIPRLTDVLALCTDFGAWRQCRNQARCWSRRSHRTPRCRGLPPPGRRPCPGGVLLFRGRPGRRPGCGSEQPRALLVEAIPGDFLERAWPAWTVLSSMHARST